MEDIQISITYAGGETLVSMFDNPQARQFLSMLPLDVVFEDFAGKEKIFYLPQKLNVKDGQNAETIKGDFCYFAPWGNIAIFYKGMGYGTSLYVLGRVTSGKESLARQGDKFKAKIEISQ